MCQIARSYQCEVKRLFSRNGLKRCAMGTEFRRKDCQGSVKLRGKHVSQGPEHKFRQESEYCPAGIYFRRNPRELR
jgi:hypothetical protein